MGLLSPDDGVTTRPVRLYAGAGRVSTKGRRAREDAPARVDARPLQTAGSPAVTEMHCPERFLAASLQR
jgi:hypothetical protein